MVRPLARHQASSRASLIALVKNLAPTSFSLLHTAGGRAPCWRHKICYVVLRSIDINVNGDEKTHDGRMDMVVDLPNDIYIVEFKLDRPASEAMEQIRGKEYAGKYALSGKRITLIGISFSAEKRTIVEELVEELPA